MPRLTKLMLSTILVTLTVIGLSGLAFANGVGMIAVVPPTEDVTVSTTFSIDIWTYSLESQSLRGLGFTLVWDPTMVEFVGYESHPPEGWFLPGHVEGSDNYLFYFERLTGSAYPGDHNWITVNFHCLDSGPTQIDLQDPYYMIDDSESMYYFEGIMPASFNQVAPVGGIVMPVDKLAVLTPYLALAGLIAAVSTVYVMRRRKD